LNDDVTTTDAEGDHDAAVDHQLSLMDMTASDSVNVETATSEEVKNVN